MGLGDARGSRVQLARPEHLHSYWVQPSIDLCPPGAATTPQGLEDPFLWKDKSGVYHAVMSNGLYHAYSVDGADGRVDAHATHELARRAGWKPFGGRPHLVTGRDGFTRIALAGACYTDEPVPFGGSTMTGLNPIDPPRVACGPSPFWRFVLCMLRYSQFNQLGLMLCS